MADSSRKAAFDMARSESRLAQTMFREHIKILEQMLSGKGKAYLSKKDRAYYADRLARELAADIARLIRATNEIRAEAFGFASDVREGHKQKQKGKE